MSNIIHFPKGEYLKNINKRPKLTEEEINKVTLMNARRNADQLAESLAVDILTVLQEQIPNMDTAEFIADLAVMIEMLKSTLYREYDLPHPIQEIVSKIAVVKVLPNGEKITELNYKPILKKQEEEFDIEFIPDVD
jgi:hypothetical protein|tara:strand:+ start:709 stop:1116 length:408 start_codon:yes stop_codon:yes gene_type:complete